MKTTALLFLLLFSPVFVYSQEKTCMLSYMLGSNLAFWTSDTEQEICKGGKMKITCLLIKDATYQWKKDGKIIPNENKEIFYADEEGVYTAEAITKECLYVSPKISYKLTKNFEFRGFRLKGEYDGTTINKAEYTICEKGELINVSLSNWFFLGETDYQWQKNGVDIEGENSEGLFIDKEGVYTVRARQGECMTQSKPLKISIKNEKVHTQLRFNNGGLYSIQSGDTLNICDSTTIGFSSTFFSVVYHKWYKDNQLIEGVTGSAAVVSEPGVYWYETILSNGCETKSESAVVKFGKKLNKPTIRFTEQAGVCKLDLLEIMNDKYFFKCYISSMNKNYKMSWFKNSVFKSSETLMIAPTNESASYKVVVDVGSCSVEQTYEYDASRPRIVKLSNALIKNGEINICGGEEVELKYPITMNWVVPGLDKLQWFKDDRPIQSDDFYLRTKESGKYYAVFRTADNSCVQYSDTITIKISDAPAIQIAKEMLSVCAYRLATSKTEGTTYAWKKEGRLIAGANNFEFLPKDFGVYSLVSNQGYCSYESNEILIEPLVKPVLTDKVSFCENDTLKLKSTEADVYIWQGPDDFTSFLQNPVLPSLKKLNSGLYSLFRTIGQCVLMDTISIKVNENPKMSINRADEYCMGKNITMIGKADNTDVLWITPKQNEYNSAILNILNATTDNNGIYIANTTDYRTGCTTRIATEIMVKESPCSSIELIQPKQKLCAFAKNELEFRLNESFPPEEAFNLYYLYSSGEKQIIASAIKGPLKFDVNNLGAHSFVIESTKSKVISNVISVDVELVSYSISHSFTQACSGDVVPLKLDSAYYKFDKIQWIKDGKEIPGAVNYLHDARESGSYWAKVERNGCAAIDSVEDHVGVKIIKVEKPYIYARFPYFNVCDGVSTIINSNTGNSTGVQLQWQFNGTDIPGATENLYIASQPGDYTLTVTQEDCQAVSENERLMITHPTIGISGYKKSENGIVEICEGTELELMSNDFYDQPADGLILQWQKNGIDIPLTISSKYKIKEEGKYRLKVIKGDCVVFSNTIIVRYGKPKLLEFGIGNNEFCVGEEVLAKIKWRNDFVYDSIKYTIYRNNQLFTTAGRPEDVKLKESGNYHATMSFKLPNSTKTCTVYSDTVSVSYKDKLVNYAIKDITPSAICADSIIISGNPWGSTYKAKHQWTFNGDTLAGFNDFKITARQSGMYQLATQTESGCTYVSNPINIQLKKLYPYIEKFWAICSDSLHTLRAYVKNIENSTDFISPSGLFSYEWQLDGKVVGAMERKDVLKSGNYKIIVKQGECMGTDSIMVDASEVRVKIPQTLISNKDSLFICPEGSVSIEAPQGDFTYSWLRGSQTVNNGHLQTVNATQEGTYKVWIEKGGCGSMSNTVVVKEKIVLPTAFISGDAELNGDSAKVRVDLTSLPPWTIKLTNNQEFRAVATPFEFSVKPLSTTVYELASVRNNCGEGSVSGKAMIKIIILGNEELAGAKVKVFPVPTRGICQLSVETLIPEKIGFQLYNVEGKMLLSSEENKAGTSFKDTLSLESMPDGVYILKIRIGDKNINRKIVKGN